MFQMNEYVGYAYTATIGLIGVFLWRRPVLAASLALASGLVPFFFFKWGFDPYPHKGPWLVGAIGISFVVLISCIALLALHTARDAKRLAGDRSSRSQ